LVLFLFRSCKQEKTDRQFSQNYRRKSRKIYFPTLKV
jgi:hypothetical protein